VVPSPGRVVISTVNDFVAAGAPFQVRGTESLAPSHVKAWGRRPPSVAAGLERAKVAGVTVGVVGVVGVTGGVVVEALPPPPPPPHAEMRRQKPKTKNTGERGILPRHEIFCLSI